MVPYFTFFGIPETFAYDYMTYKTGTLDIALAILILSRPMRSVMLHMAVWGLLTALLRPVTGESWFELVERGANYGMPLALLVLSGWFDFLGWFGVAESSQAVDLMIWVDAFEVMLGLAVLFKPVRSLLVFVLVWKLGTELLRPLVGQPNYQFVERAGDYVLPLALSGSPAAAGRPRETRPLSRRRHS